jgi:hypothetical protein
LHTAWSYYQLLLVKFLADGRIDSPSSLPYIEVTLQYRFCFVNTVIMTKHAV